MRPSESFFDRGEVLPAARDELPAEAHNIIDGERQSGIERCKRAWAASVLQAAGFRGDVTAFRLNARLRPKTGSEPAFRRNTAERVYTIEAAHNPEVAGSNPAPATGRAPETGLFP
jgi:hypothetical protein